MQMLVLALLLGIFIHDSEPALLGTAALGPWTLAAVALLPKLALAALYGTACRITRRRLGSPAGSRALRSLERINAIFRYGAVLLYFLDLWVGLLDASRRMLPRAILANEILIMTPTLLLIAWSWWVYYPIDRRLREASLLSRLDAGQPIHPIWTRGQYLLAQFRHQVLLILAPLLLLLAWRQIVERYAPEGSQWLGMSQHTILLLSGSGGIFLFAPVMIRHIWDTVPLPEGELRDRLERLCAQHRVGVRHLLLWRTFGGLINAAVMGIIAPVRYILLSDALLDLVPTAQIEAVMAHEVAHIRRRHIFWLMAVAMASGGVMLGVWSVGIEGSAHFLARSGSTGLAQFGRQLLHHDILLHATSLSGALACWAAIFGWVSRRFERQADTFAVQHIALQRTPPGEPASPPHIDADSVETMTLALQHVADLNHIPAHRRSWRHGSIAWRQDYLRGLIGQRIDRLTIDRHVLWIKLATAALLLAVFLVGQGQLEWMTEF